MDGHLLDSQIPVYRALIEAEELAAATETLASGWLGMGEAVGRFEQGVAEVLGVEADRVVAVSTGAAALHVALLLAGVGPGDEVVVPAFGHLADVQMVLACGATPVFCDVADDSLCVDASTVAAAVSERTAGVVAIDYGGAAVDEAAIGTAVGPGVRIVRDAAHAFGTMVDGVPVGAASDLAIFSFDPVKSLTCIDAGVVVAPSAAEARQARSVRILGSDQPAEVMYTNARTWDYDAIGPGFRYHLSNVHAAIGIAQLAKLDRIRDTRRRACERYLLNLKGMGSIQVPPDAFHEANPFLFWIRVPADRRDGLREQLAAEGIATGIHWHPLHRHTYFADYRRSALPVSERAGEEILSLPLHSAPMADALIDRVCEAVIRNLA